MDGYLFIAQGDITRLTADAIAFSASAGFEPTGHLHSAFRANVAGFEKWFAQLRKGEAAGAGDTHWLALGPRRRPQGVVAVVAAGREERGEDQARQAVRAALTTAAKELRAAGREDRLLVALPAFRAGKEADRRAVLASARAAVEAARETLDGLPGVDAAFVTYTPALYQVFLQARRDARARDEDNPPDELRRAIARRECVLFAGAGLSKAAGLPGWGTLVRRLADELKIEWSDRLDYLDVAQWYREAFGPEALARVLRETFAGAAAEAGPTLAHYLLLALPFRYVVTTNYDRLVEDALVALKRRPVRVVRQSDVPRTGGRVGVFVVKLHGDVGRPEEVVLCRDDFDRFFQERPALAALLEGLLLNQTFFFVGYGLRDPNFRMVFNRIATMLEGARRPAFATSFEAGGVEGYLSRQWQGQGLTLVPIRGADHAEQEWRFLRWLDRLAEEVTLDAVDSFLAPDAELPAHLDALRRRLADEVGRELSHTIKGGRINPEDVGPLVEVLRFLTRHGWRPPGEQSLCDLWECLAERVDDEAARRELLVEALGAAERFADVERVRKLIPEEQ